MTDATYAKSAHNLYGDVFHYIGMVSVRGTDRDARNGMNVYYRWVQLKYNVEGNITTVRANSKGKNDSTPRKNAKIVPDSKNPIAKKSTVHYKTSYGKVDGSTVNSVGGSGVFFDSGKEVILQ